jgi:hypothetical protein
MKGSIFYILLKMAGSWWGLGWRLLEVYGGDLKSKFGHLREFIKKIEKL